MITKNMLGGFLRKLGVAIFFREVQSYSTEYNVPLGKTTAQTALGSMG